jgi:hypothetical protein
MISPRRHGDTRLFPQKTNRFSKALSFKLFNEPKDIATRLTSKAIKKLLCGVDMKRGGLLFVKRAQSYVILSPSSQRDAISDNPDDIARLPDLFPPVPVFNRIKLSRFILPAWP